MKSSLLPDTVVLCGGMGKRLRSVVRDRPKPMALINEQPFLDYQLNWLASYGFQRFVLCAGYKSNFIDEYYREHIEKGMICISHEEKPLGTGGAFLKALDKVKTDSFLGLNGDSFCPVELNKFLSFHVEKKADISLVLAKVEEQKDYGSINLAEDCRITSFQEKTNSEKGLVNAGIYLINKSFYESLSDKEIFSIEYDFFPKSLAYKIFGYVTESPLLDIGTPERYAAASEYFRESGINLFEGKYTE